MNPGDPFGLVGQVLDGQFRVDKLVGEGGFSIVYRGHHVGLDEPIAIKCLKLPAALGSALVESFVRRFRDESRLHYRLSQGNLSIARSIASGTTMAPATSALVPYMVLEWLEGRSMAQEFEVRRANGAKGRTLEEVVRLLDPAAQAIAYAHAQGVVHRDVNPGNLFLATTREGQAMKVLDFGVAKIVSDHALEMGPRAQTIGQIRIFAPAYGAPEQFDDAMGKVGAQTDVYSLAMIALECLRDRPVREGEHLGEFALKALEAELPTPRRLGVPVGDEVEATFARAVALKVEDRPADVGEFWGLLKHAMQVDAASGKAPTAHAVPASEDRWKPMPPAAGASPNRPITAEMIAPVVEVTRPGSVATPADTRGAPANRPFNMTVRMPSAPPRPGGNDSSGSLPAAAVSSPNAQSASAALAGTPGGLKSTLVMGNNPYNVSQINPSAPTQRTGPMPGTPAPPAVIHEPPQPSELSPYAHSQNYGPTNVYGATSPAVYGAPPQQAGGPQGGGSAYGAPPTPMFGSPPDQMPPAAAYGAPPQQSQYDNSYAPPSALPAPPPGAELPIVPITKSRGGTLAIVIVVVLLLAAAVAFGAYRVVSARNSDAEATPAASAAPAPSDHPATAIPPAIPAETASAAAPASPPAEPAPVASAAAPAVANEPAVPAAPTAIATATPRPPAPSSTGPTPLNVVPAPSAAPIDPKAFNPKTAKAALDIVDGILASCKTPNGKGGPGAINVTFASDGSVLHAVVDAPPFAGTPEGECAQSRFKRAHMAPFEGAPGEIVYTFHIPK